MIRNERGYALLLVIFMILLFTILGTAILGASLGGATRTETRENDVQSLHLAEKSLNQAVSYLISEYDGREDISSEELQKYMTQIQNLDNFKAKLTSTELDGANAEITDIKVESGSNLQSYKLKLTSEAVVNGVKRKMVQHVLIDSYPEFLQYAYGSEQDVIINGSPYAMGNVYAGHELKISNRAEYRYKSLGDRQLTHYPRLDGNLFVPSFHAIKYFESTDKAQPVVYKSLSTNDESELQRVLGIKYENIHLKDNGKFRSINIDESFIDKAIEATSNSIGVREKLKTVFNANNMNPFIDELSSMGLKKVAIVTQPTLPNQDDPLDVARYEAEIIKYEEYINVFNSVLSESIIHQGNLTLNGVDFKKLTYSEDARNSGKWFIVNGDLTIVNLSSDYLDLKANILVTGNVSIKGKKIKVDSTIFCLGAGSSSNETTIEDAELKGDQTDGTTKQLVLISKKNILLNRFDAFTNYGKYEGEGIKKNRLDAFFYTEGKAELYGVGSTFWLNGGFFAKGDLTINAVLGNVKEKSDESGIDFPLQDSSVGKLDSRFIVEYNNKIFEDQYSGLPRVKQISVMVGSKQLGD
ncbi:hypothetical protein [Paenibacillus sp. NRS-1760]|uniref:hypothetical protein n=1 Tax=Paenibacillus sp. NRS-1760 TaxID=3233902 RepID=UPI003D2A6BF4